MNQLRERCAVTGKAMFTTEHEIQVWLGEYRKHKSPRARRMKAYKCRFCGTHHLTKWQHYNKRK